MSERKDFVENIALNQDEIKSCGLISSCTPLYDKQQNQECSKCV